MTGSRLSTAVVAAVVLAGAVAPAAGAGFGAVDGTTANVDGTSTNVAETNAGTISAFVVDLHADGSATVTARYAFDLSADSERTAFEQFENNETVRAEYASLFERRMQDVAGAMENETGRSMSVSSPEVDLRTVDDTGVVTFSVEWSDFASTSDGDLVVREPFAGDFDPSRNLVVNLPDDFETTSSTPSPDRREDGTLAWNAGTSLSDFRLVASETVTDGSTTEHADSQTTAETPGFGALGAVVAVLAAGVLARRR